MVSARPPLPVDAVVPNLVRDLTTGANVVLQAEPGAGKTTRVPPALLRAVDRDIVVLQPRRLAARLAARRVAAELGESVGDTCGYQVRFENRTSAKTRIRFVTEGVLTRSLRDDILLTDVSVVIFDEFHERHLDTDVGLALARRAQQTRDDLRIVVMSATLDPDPVAAFLAARIHACPGRTHAIQIDHDRFGSDRRLGTRVSRGLRRLLDEGLDGDVLVFLPGAREIRDAEDACASLARAANLDIASLHGDLPADAQDRAVQPGPRRKLILSTNVAETSVTVEGVTAVIDSGLARVAAHDPWAGLPTLALRKISRASANQRAGRAGRLQPGRCLRLYTEADFRRRPPHDRPEVARLDLAGARLDLAACGVQNSADFSWFEAPPHAVREAADHLLRRLGALDEEGRLTPIGRGLTQLPVHPRFGRVLQEGRAHRIPRLVARAVALWTERDIRRDRRRNRSHGVSADVLSDLRDLDQAGPELHPAAVRNVTRVANQLYRAIGGGRDNAPDPEEALAVATLAGFPDRVARVQDGGRLALSGGGKADLDPTSVTGGAQLVVAVTAEQRRDHGRNRIVVRSAVAIEAETIVDVREGEVTDRTQVRLDEAAGRIVAITELRYGELVLDQTKMRTLPPQARDVFRKAVVAADRSRVIDPDALATLRSRMGFLHAHGLTPASFDNHAVSAVLETLAEEHDSFAAIKRADPVARLQASLPAATRGQLERLAPLSITLPGGRRLTVHYEADRPPWVQSRLQDFFGMRHGPTIGHETFLVLHLLAPNQRAVQVTTDLAGFWDRHYLSLRKQLMRRYPKHAWPEDPRTAVPPRPAGRRRR